MFKYIEVKELSQFVTRDHNNMEQDMVLLQTADDHVFAVLASYIEQEAGSLHSPYGGHELVFHLDDVEFGTNEGEVVHASEVEYIFPENVVKDDTPRTFGNTTYLPSGA